VHHLGRACIFSFFFFLLSLKRLTHIDDLNELEMKGQDGKSHMGNNRMMERLAWNGVNWGFCRALAFVFFINGDRANSFQVIKWSDRSFAVNHHRPVSPSLAGKGHSFHVNFLSPSVRVHRGKGIRVSSLLLGESSSTCLAYMYG
jgi:hypothetical protein